MTRQRAFEKILTEQAWDKDMVDQAIVKLLKHAQRVCQATLDSEDLENLEIQIVSSLTDSLPVPVFSTHEFMVFVDFTIFPNRVMEIRIDLTHFLAKDVGIFEANQSTWLYWGEGERLPTMTTDLFAQPNTYSPSDAIAWLKTDTILPKWLDHLLFDSLDACYDPDWKRFEYNLDADDEDLRIYLGTYFPRSYAEAFCISDALFDTEAYAAHWGNRTEASLLDIGCGTGGNLVGTLTALTKHFPHLETIYVEGFDGNEKAINIANRILSTFANQTKSTINITLTQHRIERSNDLPFPKYGSYDFITSFKMVGELISAGRGACDNFYYNLLDGYISHLSDIGVFMLLDVTTKPEHADFYPLLLNRQSSSYMRNHEEYSTIFPTSCYIHEQNCHEHCFTQKEFSVAHRTASKNRSRVAYRVIGRKTLADVIHRDSKQEAEYIIKSRSGSQVFGTCALSSGCGGQLDGYKTNT